MVRHQAPFLVHPPSVYPLRPPAAGQLTNTTAGDYRIGTFTCAYPYTNTSGTFSIVGSATSSTSTTNTTTYNTFYNIVVTDVVTCEGPRVPDTAYVTPPPTLTITSGSTLCKDDIYALSVTSNVADYDSYVWSPTANLY